MGPLGYFANDQTAGYIGDPVTASVPSQSGDNNRGGGWTRDIPVCELKWSHGDQEIKGWSRIESMVGVGWNWNLSSPSSQSSPALPDYISSNPYGPDICAKSCFSSTQLPDIYEKVEATGGGRDLPNGLGRAELAIIVCQQRKVDLVM
jgi:hypothetical protein